MSTGQTAAAPPLETGPLSIDQLTAEFEAEAEAPAEEEEEAPPVEDEPAEEIEAEADEEEATEVEEEDEAGTPAAPIPDPPQSWSAEDRDGWAELTPKARETVLRREADRDKAVAKAVQEASLFGKQVQTYADQVKEFARLGTDAFEARWGEKTQGPIDWASALRNAQTDEDFNAITRNKALYDAEKTEVERAQKAAAEQSHVAHAAFMAEEYKKLPDVAPELVDPKTGEARRKAVADFLTTHGIEPEQIQYATAAELRIASLALDGLKYREAQTRANQAASVPRKNPVSQAKPAPTGGAAGAPSTARQHAAAAHARLSKTGSVNDLVALFDAEDAQKARKAPKR